jgi:hypothetical protein
MIIPDKISETMQQRYGKISILSISISCSDESINIAQQLSQQVQGVNFRLPGKKKPRSPSTGARVQQ